MVNEADMRKYAREMGLVLTPETADALTLDQWIRAAALHAAVMAHDHAWDTTEELYFFADKFATYIRTGSRGDDA